MALRVIEDAPGFAKVSFQGPQGSGKSRTAVETAIYLHRRFGSKKPIAFFDTEAGSDYLVDLIVEGTGMKPIRDKTRSFSDLLDDVAQCVKGEADIFLTDSITHVWRELNDGYLEAVNRALRKKGMNEKKRLDVSDIQQIKKLWEPWPNLFINSPIHMIVCGREGDAWGREENEETGKSELISVGKKMKVEGEFGYEASLMISMQAIQTAERVIRKRNGAKEREARSIINVATILKDRFDVINGEMFEMPTGEDFAPHFDKLRPELHHAVDVSVKSDSSIEMGEDGFGKEKRLRTIYAEEVQGELIARWPGQTADEKKAKSDALFRIFGTRSWTRVESLDSEKLRAGLERLKAERDEQPIPPEQQEPETALTQ